MAETVGTQRDGFDGCAIVTCNYETYRGGGAGDHLAHNLAIARNLAIASRHSITPTSIFVVRQVNGTSLLPVDGPSQQG
jgi:hypothetical protein